MFSERIITKDYSSSKTESFYYSLNSRTPESPGARLADRCDSRSTPTTEGESQDNKLSILLILVIHSYS